MPPHRLLRRSLLASILLGAAMISTTPSAAAANDESTAERFVRNIGYLMRDIVTGRTGGDGTGEAQRKQGTRWVKNYLDIARAALVGTFAEVMGTRRTGASSQDVRGWLEQERQRGNISNEVAEYARESILSRAFGITRDTLRSTLAQQGIIGTGANKLLDELFPPSPSDTKDANPSPYISTSRTKDKLGSLDDLVYDIANSTHAQYYTVLFTYLNRTAQHAQALDKEARDGGGRLGFLGAGGPPGLDGEPTGQLLVSSGDVRAGTETALQALLTLLTTQYTAGVTGESPDRPLPPVLGPSPGPVVRNPVIPGGSVAGYHTAQTIGVLPAPDFSPLANISPDPFLDSIVDRLNNNFSDFDAISDAPSRFPGSSLGNMSSLFGTDRLRTLLAGGGGSSPAPPRRNAAENAACPTASARRTPDVVTDAARALQLPTSAEWVIGLSSARELFGIRGIHAETAETVTLGAEIFRDGSCVWAVRAGATDAVFVSDAEQTALRLTSLVTTL